MVTRVPDVTRLVDRLEDAAWVKRERSSADRRVVTVVLTPAGKKLVDKLDEPITELHRETLGHLSSAEVKELNRLLVKARSPLEA